MPGAVPARSLVAVGAAGVAEAAGAVLGDGVLVEVGVVGVVQALVLGGPVGRPLVGEVGVAVAQGVDGGEPLLHVAVDALGQGVEVLVIAATIAATGGGSEAEGQGDEGDSKGA